METPPLTKPCVHLVDATGYLFRAYHAIGPMKATDGTPTNAVFGLVQTMAKYLREAQPAYVAGAFDASMESFRNGLDATYKANRAAPPADLEPQFDLAVEALAAIGVRPAELEGFEADDVIATLASRAVRDGHPVLVASFDKDLAQLVGEGVRLVDLGRGEPIDSAGVEARFGVPPALVADYLALCGDAIDNVPGIPGVGPKTAAALLRHFGSLEALLAAPERILETRLRGKESLVERVRSGAELARLGRSLTGLRTDVPLGVRVAELRYRGPDRARAVPLFERLGFRRLTEAVRAGTFPATAAASSASRRA
jgi:DNA polymerase-1